MHHIKISTHREGELSAARKGIIHPHYGDLSRQDAVVMQTWSLSSARLTERKSLFIHLTVTGRCNVRCKGCINVYVTPDSPDESIRCGTISDTVPRRDAQAIIHLASHHPDENLVICFYGGEPLLAADKMDEIYRIIQDSALRDRVRYLIYTNAELIARSLEKYPLLMKSIWLYAISIDGRITQHNAIRKGTSLSRIHKNIKALSSVITGEILMWSTLREEQSLLDCFREFQYLYRNNMAHHFFWHWVETERVFNDFPRYLSTYEKDLRTIMGHYLSQMKEGRILPIAHINELIVYLLTGKKRGTTSCGVELSRNYDIVSGKIHACADLPPGYTIGEIDEEGTPHIRERDLSPLVSYKTALGCHGCGVHPYCGGRCPVQALTGSPERLLQYCQLMRLHGGVVQDHMAEITTSMAANGITAQDLYDRSAVIAQFTDVTP